MPIQIRCKCGKSLNAPDAAAGKAVKCPSCQSTLKVPAKTAAGAAAPTAQKSSPKPAATPDNDLDDLFNEEGFAAKVESVCPSCREAMAATAVLCTKCGFHKESGIKFESHKTAGVDIDHGTLALQKAESDMFQAAEMQRKLASGPGMPWWGLALVLFVMSSGLIIAVLAVNASRRVDAAAPANPMALFLGLTGVAFCLVGQGATLMILIHAFKRSVGTGLMCMFIPLYILYYVFTNFRDLWKYFLVAIVTGGIAGGFFAASTAQLAAAAAAAAS